MKLTKGNLTPKHAAAIALLVIVLYAVFPSTSSPTGSGNAVPTTTPYGSSPQAEVVAAPAEVITLTDAVPTAADPAAPSISLDVLDVRELDAVTAKTLELVQDDNLFASIAADELEPSDETAAVTPAPSVPSAPVVPPVAAKAANTNVSLFYSSSRGSRFAVVNGAVVKPGDVTASGLRIKGISPSGVDVHDADDASSLAQPFKP